MKNFVRSEQGFSIIEVMIAAAIMSIVSLGMASMMDYMNRGQQNALALSARQSVIEQLRRHAGSMEALNVSRALTGPAAGSINLEACIVVTAAVDCVHNTTQGLNLRRASDNVLVAGWDLTNAVLYSSGGAICNLPAAQCPLAAWTEIRAYCPGGVGPCVQAATYEVTVNIERNPAWGNGLRFPASRVNVVPTWNSTAMSTFWQPYTTGGHITTANSGNVGIGTIIPTAPAYKLEVVGEINATVAVRAASVVLSSDARLKKNITPVESSLDRLSGIHAYNFHWNDPKKHGKSMQLGVLAQEVEKSFPEAISVGHDGYKSVAYPSLIAPVIDAINELRKENQALRDRVEQLENSCKPQP